MVVAESKRDVLVFCNSKSGGGFGEKVLSAFRKVLGDDSCFDLGKTPPEEVLSREDVLKQAQEGLRLVVCGGDGTMTWIMASIDAVKEAKGLVDDKYQVSIAAMPLGTGNDFSRSFGWGGAFRQACLEVEPWLAEVRKADCERLDRWIACVMPSAEHQQNDKAIPTIPEVFSVHEYDTKPLGGPRHQLITRGRHFSQAASRHSEAMLIEHDREMRSITSRTDDARGSESKSFDQNFLQVIEEDERVENVKEKEDDSLKKTTDEENEFSDEGDEGDAEREEKKKFDHHGQTLIASHVAPSESVLKAGSTWRSYDGTFSNYISFGVDAASAYAFHAARRANPKRFSSRLKNQLLYAWLGVKTTGGCCCCDGPPPKLAAIVDLSIREVPSGEWIKTQVPQGCRGFIVLNLQSYAAGRDLWGNPKTKSNNWHKPDAADGFLEIVTTNSIFELGTKLVTANGLGGHARRLCQAAEIRIKLTQTIHMQIDGEPWIQPAATIHLKATGQANVLRRRAS